MENGVNEIPFNLDEQTSAEDDSGSKMSRCDSEASFKPKLESRVLVLYTGGTIGMKSDKHGGTVGLTPRSRVLGARAWRYARNFPKYI